MRHRHVHAGGAGQPPDDRLAIGGHRAHAHPVAGDLGLVQSADDPAGAPQQLVRPAPQLRVGRMQVDGRVGGFQMDRAVPIGPQVHVGCVHHPGQAGHRRGADDEPRRFGPGRLPRHERHRAGRTRQPGQLRNLAPGTAHDHLRRDQRACRRVHVACRARRPGRGRRAHTGHPSRLARHQADPGAGGGPGQVADRGPGQQVALPGKPGDLHRRRRRLQRRFQLGRRGGIEKASRVSPPGQAAYPRRELRMPAGVRRPLEVPGRLVPGRLAGSAARPAQARMPAWLRSW